MAKHIHETQINFDFTALIAIGNISFTCNDSPVSVGPHLHLINSSEYFTLARAKHLFRHFSLIPDAALDVDNAPVSR